MLQHSSCVGISRVVVIIMCVPPFSLLPLALVAPPCIPAHASALTTQFLSPLTPIPHTNTPCSFPLFQLQGHGCVCGSEPRHRPLLVPIRRLHQPCNHRCCECHQGMQECLPLASPASRHTRSTVLAEQCCKLVLCVPSWHCYVSLQG